MKDQIDTHSAILGRRSHSRLVEPGPNDDQLRAILAAAAAAPDHGRLRPWRFIVVQDNARAALGRRAAEALASEAAASGMESDRAKTDKVRASFDRAPVVIAVAAVRSPPSRIPWEEQVASTAAATQNLLLSASAHGFGSIWRTGDIASSPGVKAALGLIAEDVIVGFIFVGTQRGELPDREPVDLDQLVHYWRPDD